MATAGDAAASGSGLAWRRGSDVEFLLSARLGTDAEVLTRYLRASIHPATSKVLEDGSFFGEIPGFEEV